MPKSKATHLGECQICGRVQKLPNGKLAKHGYMVQWSMFQGTCPGSDELPYEQSCDLIRQRIPLVEEKIQDMLKFHSELLQPAVEPIAYVKVYSRESRLYSWVKAKLTEVKIKNVTLGLEWRQIVANYQGGAKNLKSSDYTQGESLLSVATKQNQLYANVYKLEITQTENYLKWCQDRIHNWELKELQPI